MTDVGENKIDIKDVFRFLDGCSDLVALNVLRELFACKGPIKICDAVDGSTFTCGDYTLTIKKEK